eukprot:JP440159.1.p2 GENE.JP440159.1~~JP440159.1.p2  ORF type:complete len:104 (+),score=14.69 JP440159.1:3-314(+)
MGRTHSMKIFLACLCLYAVCTLAFPLTGLAVESPDSVESNEIENDMTANDSPLSDDPAAELEEDNGDTLSSEESSSLEVKDDSEGPRSRSPTDTGRRGEDGHQ